MNSPSTLHFETTYLLFKRYAIYGSGGFLVSWELVSFCRLVDGAIGFFLRRGWFDDVGRFGDLGTILLFGDWLMEALGFLSEGLFRLGRLVR